MATHSPPPAGFLPARHRKRTDTIVNNAQSTAKPLPPGSTKIPADASHTQSPLCSARLDPTHVTYAPPLLRIASAGVLGALMAGCVGVPGDPTTTVATAAAATTGIGIGHGVRTTRRDLHAPARGLAQLPPPPPAGARTPGANASGANTAEREARERREHERRDMERRRDFERRDAERQRETHAPRGRAPPGAGAPAPHGAHAHQPRVPQR